MKTVFLVILLLVSLFKANLVFGDHGNPDEDRFRIIIDELIINAEEGKDILQKKSPKFEELLKDELFRNQVKIESLFITNSESSYRNVVREYRNSSQEEVTDQRLPHFLAQVDLRRGKGLLITVRLQWIDLKDSRVSRQYEFPIRGMGEDLIAEAAKRIAESLILNLTKKVRLAIAPFIPVWLDSTNMNDKSNLRFLRELNHSLRYVIGTSLSKTPWIGIADISFSEEEVQKFFREQQRKQRQKETLMSRFRPETAIEAGQLVFPNYILYGNLLITDSLSDVRLDCWVVSIESQLVVAAEGITISSSSLGMLTKSVQGLANRLSKAIEMETAINRPPIEIIAVVPSRNMEIENFYTSRVMEVITTLNLKLQQITDSSQALLYFDYEALKRYMLPEKNPNRISYDELILQFNVDNLLKVNVQEKDRQYIASLSFESLKDPRKKPWYGKISSQNILDLDHGMNSMLSGLASQGEDFKGLFNCQGKGECMNKLENVIIPYDFKNYGISLNTGQIARWGDGKPLFLRNAANRIWTLSFSIEMPPFKFPVFKKIKNLGFGGMAGWDRGGRKFDFEIQNENPGLELGDIGDIQIQEWFVSVYPIKFLRWRNFSLNLAAGPVVFFVNRRVGVGTSEQTGQDNVVIGGNAFGELEGLIYRNPHLNVSVNIRGGIMYARLKTSVQFSHPVMNYIDVNETFPPGSLGGKYISGGLSFSFRP